VFAAFFELGMTVAMVKGEQSKKVWIGASRGHKSIRAGAVIILRIGHPAEAGARANQD